MALTLLGQEAQSLRSNLESLPPIQDTPIDNEIFPSPVEGESMRGGNFLVQTEGLLDEIESNGLNCNFETLYSDWATDFTENNLSSREHQMLNFIVLTYLLSQESAHTEVKQLSLEGAVGSGKTRALEGIMAELDNLQVVEERFDLNSWFPESLHEQSFDHLPPEEQPPKVSMFGSQVCFATLTEYYRQQKLRDAASGDIVLIERDRPGDWAFILHYHTKQNRLLDDNEFRVLGKLYKLFDKNQPKNTFSIFLHAPAHELHRRVKERARKGEGVYTPKWLEMNQTYTEDELINRKNTNGFNFEPVDTNGLLIEEMRTRVVDIVRKFIASPVLN